MGDARDRRRATAMLSATFVAISYNEASAQERATCSQVVQNQPRGQGAPVLLASFVSLAYQSFWSLGDCSSCLFELRCCCISACLVIAPHHDSVGKHIVIVVSSQVVQNQPRGQGAPVLLASFVSLAYQSFWSLGDCSSCLFELRCCCISACLVIAPHHDSVGKHIVIVVIPLARS
jgi:hypothetical protein